MAITNVPKINGPDYGGVIYGLNLNIGYSNQPSKLIIDVVNQNGVYSFPRINDSATIRFGSFTFNGIVWSYNLKENAAETTLQITLIDNSIILDRYYVLLWKRGFLGRLGTKQDISKRFIFNEESILIPVKETSSDGFGYTTFKEKRLPTIEVNAFSFKHTPTTIGNVILVGNEKFPDSKCDIPDTYYTFNDLKSQIPVNMVSAPNNNTWKTTHEGTLREVLSSWCSDLGFDFYWDYSSNNLRFYDVSRGISTNLPDLKNPNIISKETSLSMEGTFRHYGLAYTAIPKSPIKSLSATKNITILYSLNPYPLSYFISKVGVIQSLKGGEGRWGGKRSESQFLEAAFLGYVSRSLRDLYCFQSEHWEALGYKVNTGINIDKLKIISFLRKNGYEEMISNLESFDAKNLPNYDFNLISRDETVADKWNETEQLLLTNYLGAYYRTSDSSSSFFYCSSNATMEIDITVDPEGQTLEDNSIDFANRKVFNRGQGKFSHDNASAREELKYNDISESITNCAPIHIDLKEAGILDNLLIAEILNTDSAKLVNTLVIFPNSNKFVKQKIGFNSSLGRSTNPFERNLNEIRANNIKNNRKNCPQFEENLQKNSCQSYEEIARDRAIKQISPPEDKSEDDFISGLFSKSARSCNIKLKSGSLTLIGPADGPYQAVCRYQITVNKLSTFQTQQFLWSVGSPGKADDVAEIRITNENITDPEEDKFQVQRSTELIKPADSSSVEPQKTIKYVFAGEPGAGVFLDPNQGLTNLDISLSSDGYTTTATFSTRTPRPSKANNVVRYVHSQFNRASYNAS